MIVRNRIPEVPCTQPLNDLGALAYLIVHCTGLSYDRDHPTAEADTDPVYLTEVLRRDQEIGGVAYALVIDTAGVVHQLAPLLTRTFHALEYNHYSIGVAVIGERGPINDAQYGALVELAALLVPLAGGIQVRGHTELPRATNDTHKICPRPAVPSMLSLRQDVGAAMVPGWQTWPAGQVAETISAVGLTL